jgi:hypothetical protein
MGTLGVSAAGSYLAAAHIFRWFILAPLLIVILYILVWRRRARLLDVLVEEWREFASGWDFSRALAVQGLFLLFVFVYVASIAPDTNSDAIRFYWSYVKWLRHDGGFPQIAQQWSYIIPQAGLTYAGVLLSLGGSPLARLSMLMVWMALIGITLRRNPGSGANLAVALVMASCPAVLWTATSLMQDSFVCLSVVMLALVCLESEKPGSPRSWLMMGALTGMAWAAKFSTLTYAVPLVLAASYRGCRNSSLWKTFRGCALAGLGGFAIALPWMIHSYRQSGNPVFPFFFRLFPAPLWPHGVGFANLDTFKLPPGPRGWFLWPLDMTYQTSQFAEGSDGRLGLVLIFLLVLAVPAIRRGNEAARALILAAVVGTALLWSQTAYIRYWIPGLWLLAIASQHGVSRIVRSKWSGVCFTSFALVLVSTHILYTMAVSWADAQGWAWDFYSGKVKQDVYLDRSFRGFKELRSLEPFGKSWPKVWFTGFSPIGYFPVRPLEATSWELSLHAPDPRGRIAYLGSSGCDYWVIDEEAKDAFWLRATGIPLAYWDDKRRVASAGPLKVYRMKTAAEALREFDARANPGTDMIMDGGFEQDLAGRPRYWSLDGESKWLRPSSAALEGQGCLCLGPVSSLRQVVSLPPGLNAIELGLSVRSADPRRSARVWVRLEILGFGPASTNPKPGSIPEPEGLLRSESGAIQTGTRWTAYHFAVTIPVEARYAVVLLGNDDAQGAGIVDAIHLHSR